MYAFSFWPQAYQDNLNQDVKVKIHEIEKEMTIEDKLEFFQSCWTVVADLLLNQSLVQQEFPYP